MPQNRTRNYFLRLIAVWLTLGGLFAAEHKGTVKSGTLPVPGATITATLDTKKAITTTDDQGVYTFPDLDSGVWHMTVEMLGFATATRDVAVAPEAPSPSWDLKLQSTEDLTAAVTAKAVATAAATPATPAAPAVAAAATPAATTPAAPTTSATTTPAPNGRGGAQPAGGRGGRGQNQQGGRGAAGNNGRPSLLGAYQEVGVSQSADSSASTRKAIFRRSNRLRFRRARTNPSCCRAARAVPWRWAEWPISAGASADRADRVEHLADPAARAPASAEVTSPA